ncbi:CAAX prenyl protease [Sporothrix epigloea]|uniref:intramembrane prenyl-peptidase Rce1 n=1 Tax=Sporothrix epigloea TaxID=1892477 RepID=A0ABP0E4N9_9PEZI
MPAVQGLIDKYILHKQQLMLAEEIPPPISTRVAVITLIAYTVIYVAPFYLSSLTRPSATLSRDAPSVIRARITSVSLSCGICSIVTFLVLTSHGNAGDATRLSGRDAIHMMGYFPVGLAETINCLLLTAGLFLGPLFEHLVVERGWRAWVGLPSPDVPRARVLGPLFQLDDWVSWRNYVAGPITEEVLFRAAAVPLLLLAHTPVRRTVLLSPIVFGLAHLHHAYEFSVTNPHVPKWQVAIRSLLQFAYTTLFGCYATFLYLRTGSLLAVCVVHSFCNSMGLPRFYGRVQRETDASEEKPASSAAQGNLLWTVAYYILLFIGAVYWYKHLWPLTESAHALVSIS